MNPSSASNAQESSSSATSAGRDNQSYTTSSPTVAIAPGNRRMGTSSSSPPSHEPGTLTNTAADSFNAFASSTGTSTVQTAQDTTTTPSSLERQDQEQQGPSKRLKATGDGDGQELLQQQAAATLGGDPPSLFTSSAGPASTTSFAAFPHPADAAPQAPFASSATGLLRQQLYSGQQQYQQQQYQQQQAPSLPSSAQRDIATPSAGLFASVHGQGHGDYRLPQQINAMRSEERSGLYHRVLTTAEQHQQQMDNLHYAQQQQQAQSSTGVQGGNITGHFDFSISPKLDMYHFPQQINPMYAEDRSSSMQQHFGLSTTEQYQQHLDEDAAHRARLQRIEQLREQAQQQRLGIGMGMSASGQLDLVRQVGAGAGEDPRPPTIPNMYGYQPYLQNQIDEGMLRQDMISSQPLQDTAKIHSRSQLLASMRYMQGETDLNKLEVPIPSPSPAVAGFQDASRASSSSLGNDPEQQTFKRADGMHCLASGVPHYKSRPVIPLAAPDDVNWLSEYLSFVRAECVEVFLATYRDVQSRNTSKKVGEDQVGIRCRFCAHLHHRDRAGRSSSFPSSISRIYQSLTMMLRDHFANCTEMPPKTREKFFALKSLTTQGASESKRYWIESAGQIGLIDTDYGIYMKDKDAVLLKAKLEFEQQEEGQTEQDRKKSEGQD